MTIKEFYEWAIAHDVENAEVRIGYRDGGGCYSGYDDLVEQEIYIEKRGNFTAVEI